MTAFLQESKITGHLLVFFKSQVAAKLSESRETINSMVQEMRQTENTTQQESVPEKVDQAVSKLF